MEAPLEEDADATVFFEELEVSGRVEVLCAHSGNADFH